MAISAKQVKALRDATGAGMMDCKKALTANDGDLDAAGEWLQKKGIAAARKRSGRAASEGLIKVFRAEDGRSAVMLEVNCETDFVARNEEFQGFVSSLGALALANETPSVAALHELDWDGALVAQRVMERSGKIGENLIVRRLRWVHLEEGVAGHIGSYVHDGKIGVVVAATAANDDIAGSDAVAEIVKDVAMHVAAMDPVVVSADELDPAVVAKQTEILTAQAAESGKPAAILEKMVTGRINKWKKEIALLDQPFVKDSDLTVGKYAAKAGQERAGGPVTVNAFLRFALGGDLE